MKITCEWDIPAFLDILTLKQLYDVLKMIQNKIEEQEKMGIKTPLKLKMAKSEKQGLEKDSASYHLETAPTEEPKKEPTTEGEMLDPFQKAARMAMKAKEVSMGGKQGHAEIVKPEENISGSEPSEWMPEVKKVDDDIAAATDASSPAVGGSEAATDASSPAVGGSEAAPEGVKAFPETPDELMLPVVSEDSTTIPPTENSDTTAAPDKCVEAVTLKDVEEALSGYMLKHQSLEGAEAILKEFGAKKIGDLKVEDYSKFKERVTEA